MDAVPYRTSTDRHRLRRRLPLVRHRLAATRARAGGQRRGGRGALAPVRAEPASGPEGEDLGEHLAAKYGTTPEASRANRGPDHRARRGVGLHLRLCRRHADPQQLPGPPADPLGGHAGARACRQAGPVRGLFQPGRGHSRPGRAGRGRPRDRARPGGGTQVLADGRYADMVRKEEALWTGRGIHAVPAMVFAGRYLVSGAQGVANYSEILRSSAPTSRV